MQFLSRRCQFRFTLALTFTCTCSLLATISRSFSPAIPTKRIQASLNNLHNLHKRSSLLSMSSSESAPSQTLLETMSEACTKSLGRPVQLGPASGGGAGGGGGASISAAIDKNTGKKYFIKKASPLSKAGSKMLHAEYEGVKEMAETNTIKVPTPIAFGEFHGQPANCAFVVFEYLQFCGGGNGYELGQQLAKVSEVFVVLCVHGISVFFNILYFIRKFHYMIYL